MGKPGTLGPPRSNRQFTQVAWSIKHETYRVIFDVSQRRETTMSKVVREILEKWAEGQMVIPSDPPGDTGP